MATAAGSAANHIRTTSRGESMERILLTVEEAAEVIGIGRTKAFELIAIGAIKSVRIGASRRIPSAAVAEYVERLRAEANEREAGPPGSTGQRKKGARVSSTT
jgi:excisionase family DNA binding protein